ncbi:MNIO family bufferin maturase [Candidatus Trichorickettsia mobilis]|uniref:MNIO family bufferin maturase n=1 Tax=Candidatus Trichorickettsia mobilis TaxID=1346319 RepID=UPI00292EEE79|nr:DUF692 domain-containing protein [Candidatus Trichorickettsia mobilis]
MRNAIVPNACGVGLRDVHYDIVTALMPPIPWLEVHSENFFTSSNYVHHVLEIITTHYPVSFHSVGLSLGSTDRLDSNHLKKLKNLISLYKPVLISEHLAWSSVEGVFLHDLLPLPYCSDSLQLLCDKVQQVQDYLGQRILIENPALYVKFPESTIPEYDFLNQLVEKTDCGILLDISNLYISSHNLSFVAEEYLAQINTDAIYEIHLAGFSQSAKGLLIDSHNGAIAEVVLVLFEYFIKNYGVRPVIFEQDQDIPVLQELIDQAEKVNAIIKEYVA